ncbi:o-succinylbenzoate synthase [Crocosphaera sp. XPORK-15E]|uniref:o-succinylbenzoate synthase n=1 Tax=Crocosphaera sp. XPORK-15E TaxID=3110247 RepID=UPI002B213BC9|nr:o-succinylbenzoate synthase [Crocosphaera sp. XPORK-15E]MEA5533120.1 o-succinylbenzoate synthase [Crocosphaera sp. XPORK-15E]
MSYNFNFSIYQRSFIKPLKTHHGIWKIREGIILKLTNDLGKITWGEITPLPWFGSETLAQSLSFCQQLGTKVYLEQIKLIPDNLPACQFAFESALEGFNSHILKENKKSKFSYLLPTGKEALSQVKIGYQQGYKTFKWKIGVSLYEEEINLLQQLINELPQDTKLRLDANGGLNLQAAQTWLKITDELNNIEFIEQPLPPAQLDNMIQLNQDHKTALALDESVANLTQLDSCYQQGWRGIFVIKPAIMGFPSRLRQLCQNYPMDLVFSSVFETSIGRHHGLKLAAELMKGDRAVGFGINDWFKDKIIKE